MITVTLHRNGQYWQAKWRDGTGKQKGKSLGNVDKVTARAAKVKARRLEDDLNAGRDADRQNMGLQAYCDWFLENRTNISEGTRELYGYTIRYLVAHFGPNRRIGSITRAEAEEWRTAMAKGVLVHANNRKCGAPAESTVCRSCRDAKVIFKKAARTGFILYNPFDELQSSSPAPDKTWAYIDRATLAKILDVCPTVDWRLFLALCRLAGLRKSEALRLRWEDIDFTSHRLTVTNPGNAKDTKHRTRTVPIDPMLYSLLFEAYNDGQAGEWVCSGARSTAMHRVIEKICKLAGIEPYTKPCHTLRKNCETDWSEKYPIQAVTDWLGNSPQVALAHYLRTEDGLFDKAAGVVSDENVHNSVPNRNAASSKALQIKG